MNLKPFWLDSVAIKTMFQTKRIIFRVFAWQIFKLGWVFGIDLKNECFINIYFSYYFSPKHTQALWIVYFKNILWNPFAVPITHLNSYKMYKHKTYNAYVFPLYKQLSFTSWFQFAWWSQHQSVFSILINFFFIFTFLQQIFLVDRIWIFKELPTPGNEFLRFVTWLRCHAART